VPRQPHDPVTALRRVVVLAGGGSRRLGRDKLAADLDGRTVLTALLDGVRAEVPGAQLVVVGPPERASAGALVVQEDPPGCGPVAGLAAGLDAGFDAGLVAGLLAGSPVPTRSQPPDDLVAVLAGDQPFAAAALSALASALLATPAGASDAPAAPDGAIGVDEDGRDQPLLAVYRVGPLRRALAEVSGRRGLAGARVRDVVARLDLVRVPLPQTAVLDVDTEPDLQRARSIVHRLADEHRP